MADRSSSVRRRVARATAVEHPARRAVAATPATEGTADRSRNDLPEAARKGTEAAIRDRGGTGGGFATLHERRADSRATAGTAHASRTVGETAASVFAVVGRVGSVCAGGDRSERGDVVVTSSGSRGAAAASNRYHAGRGIDGRPQSDRAGDHARRTSGRFYRLAAHPTRARRLSSGRVRCGD